MEPAISLDDMDTHLATGTAHTWDRSFTSVSLHVVQLHGRWWQLDEDDYYRPVNEDLAAILTDFDTRFSKAEEAIARQCGDPRP